MQGVFLIKVVRRSNMNCCLKSKCEALPYKMWNNFVFFTQKNMKVIGERVILMCLFWAE